jgi:DeoR family transcriptional regulator, fructose operon transcriptional repressor
MDIANDRKKFILNRIQSNGSISTQEVMAEFGVSDMTVRRDLISLEKERLVFRKFGGAVKPESKGYLFAFDDRICLNREKKEELCCKAAAEIKNNDIIFIDGGSTTFFLTRYLGHLTKLRVITNSLPVISEITKYPQIDLTLLGGDFDRGRKALFGKFTEQMIDQIHVHKAFIGSDGITLRKGVSSYYENESIISQKMMESSDNAYLLADSSKFNMDTYVIFSTLQNITAFVTDSGLPDHVVEMYGRQNIKILKGE